MKCLQPHQFTNPQAAGIHQLEHGPVAQAQCRVIARGGQQSLDLRLGHEFWHTQGLFGGLQLEGGVRVDVPLAQGPAEVTLEHRQAPICRRSLGLRVTRAEIRTEVGLRSLIEALAEPCLPLRKKHEIAAVSLQRVTRQAILQPKSVGKGVHTRLAHGQQWQSCGTDRHPNLAHNT
jgi:hypothetical protein